MGVIRSLKVPNTGWYFNSNTKKMDNSSVTKNIEKQLYEIYIKFTSFPWSPTLPCNPLAPSSPWRANFWSVAIVTKVVKSVFETRVVKYVLFYLLSCLQSKISLHSSWSITWSPWGPPSPAGPGVPVAPFKVPKNQLQIRK